MSDHNLLNDDTNKNTDSITDIQSSILILQQMLQIVSDLQWKNKNDSAATTTLKSTIVTTVSSSTSNSSSSSNMKHYSQIPLVLQQIYDTIYTQTSTIHHTVTKYTLLIQQLSSSSTSSSSIVESSATNTIVVPIIKDMIQSCRILVACIMSIYNSSNNNSNNSNRTTTNEDTCCCCCATFTHMKKAIRNVVYSIVQLLEKSCSDFRNSHTTTTMAQSTGMVWDACNVILEKKVPLGNRNAIRRDLLSYQMECNDTIQEFQSLCDASSSRISNNNNDDDDDEDEEEEYYTTEQEISIVTNCIGIMKCSRGTIRIALDVMDTIDQYILQHCSTSNSNNNRDEKTNDQQHQQQYYYYSIIETIYEQAYHIGYNVTDFGASLYPPLYLLPQTLKEDDNNSSSSSTFYKEFQKQSTAILELLQYILDIAENNYSSSSFVVNNNTTNTAQQQQQQLLQLNTSTIDLIHTVQAACTTRTNDIDTIIQEDKERGRLEDSNH